MVVSAASNLAGGIYLNFSDSNLVGGSTEADRNVISGNAGAGVTSWVKARPSATITSVLMPRERRILETQHGISLSSFGSHVIGGAGSQFRNVISGNDGSGIYTSNSGFNTIQGNYIGLNASGTAAIGNGTAGQNTSGISINGGTPQYIGGTAAGAGNVISGKLW